MAVFNQIIIKEGTPIEDAMEVLEELDEEIYLIQLKIKFLRENLKQGLGTTLCEIEKQHRYFLFLKIKEKKYLKYVKKLSKQEEFA